jgi:hypothetical protein
MYVIIIVHPAFDRIPPEYLDNVVALLDPSQIDFVVAARYITTEKVTSHIYVPLPPIIICLLQTCLFLS